MTVAPPVLSDVVEADISHCWLLQPHSCLSGHDVFDARSPRSILPTPYLICPKCFAATVCLAWKKTASAARLIAKHAEEAVAPSAPAARFVVYGVVSCHQRVVHDRGRTF